MLKIVIVDDEPWVMYGLAAMINNVRPQFEIIAMLDNPVNAAEKASELNPDILITDIRMPNMTGIELIQAYRKQNTDIETVIISAYKNFDVAKEAFELDVMQYLLKPFTQNDLTKVLDRIAERINKRKKIREADNAVLIAKASIYPHCFICVSHFNNPLPEMNENIIMIQYYLQGCPIAYYCSAQQKKVFIKYVVELSKKGYGFSRLYTNFNELDSIQDEAIMSLDGSFSFSNNMNQYER